MVGPTINELTALSRIAARLAPLVTGNEIAEVASHFNLIPEGSNKQARLRDLLGALWQDGRRRMDATATVIATLTVAAHDRCLHGKNEMTEDDVDEIVQDMRLLGLDPGELSDKNWRTGLRHRSFAGRNPHATEHDTTDARRKSPQVHQGALDQLNTLALDGNVDPRRRGYELQLLVLEVLQKEGLSPIYDVRNPGEQIDMAFVVANSHYLLECCWEKAPMGLPMVRELRDKVATKAEGTFGVLLSLSGFTSDINATVARGTRLNCVGLVHTQLVSVLEGRTTWTDLVLKARALASTKALFWGGLT